MKMQLKINCQSITAFPTFCTTEDDRTSAVIEFFMSNLLLQSLRVFEVSIVAGTIRLL